MITGGTMRTFLALGLVLCAACGDSGITPEPKEPSAGSTANGGAPSDGGGPLGGEGGEGGSANGGNGSIGSGYDSGSRIKVRTRVGADGSRQPVGWHDSDLNTTCLWRTASDGSERCLPDGLVATKYADDACTQPIVVQSTCAPLSFAIVSDSSDACGTTYRVYPVAAAVTPAVAYQKSGANCTSTSVPTGDVFATGPEMPASMFVAGTIEVEP